MSYGPVDLMVELDDGFFKGCSILTPKDSGCTEPFDTGQFVSSYRLPFYDLGFGSVVYIPVVPLLGIEELRYCDWGSEWRVATVGDVDTSTA